MLRKVQYYIQFECKCSLVRNYCCKCTGTCVGDIVAKTDKQQAYMLDCKVQCSNGTTAMNHSESEKQESKEPFSQIDELFLSESIKSTLIYPFYYCQINLSPFVSPLGHD